MRENKPIPGFTAAQAKERIAGYLKESLRGFPEGLFYASYGMGQQPGQVSIGGESNFKVNDYGPDQDSPFKLDVAYWVHFPGSAGPALDWFDKLVAYWAAHARTTSPVESNVSGFLRYASFATEDHYSFDFAVNQKGYMSTSWSSPYYAYETKDTGGPMPETITKNGYSAFGEPPK